MKNIHHYTLILLATACSTINASTYHLLPSTDTHTIKIEECEETIHYGNDNEKIIERLIKERILTAYEALNLGAKVGSLEIVNAALAKLDPSRVDLLTALKNIADGLVGEQRGYTMGKIMLTFVVATGAVITYGAKTIHERIIASAAFASFGGLAALLGYTQHHAIQKNYISIAQQLVQTVGISATEKQAIEAALDTVKTHTDARHHTTISQMMAHINTHKEHTCTKNLL